MATANAGEFDDDIAAAELLFHDEARIATLEQPVGTIIGSTDAAAVFALLTRSGVTLTARLWQAMWFASARSRSSCARSKAEGPRASATD